MTEVYVPDAFRLLVERCESDFGRFAYDGYGIMLSDEQLEARVRIGAPGPRRQGEFKFNWLSGGQRAGKTVLGFLLHSEAALYKRGLDPTDQRFWRNYQYATLHIAPTNELSLRMYQIASEIERGANDAQYDRKVRRSRGAGFLGKFHAGKAGEWAIVRFSNGSRIDFRSSEGMAYRLEGGQWWFTTWDEWASQSAREIHPVLYDVLMGRSRDHDAKIVPMAWPKPETEYHLIEVVRAIESGQDLDSQVVYLAADKAFFTNRKALEVERRTKSAAEWKRTVMGEPAGGASLVFKPEMVGNMVDRSLAYPALPEPGFGYLTAVDVALAHDATVAITARIPRVGNRLIVTPDHRARIVNAWELKGSDSLTLDRLTFRIAQEQMTYHSQLGIDATAMGGLASLRALRGLQPAPLAFSSRANDRLWGNMRLASITNALDVLSWGRAPERIGLPWGLIETPPIVPLQDQMAAFDPEAKDVPDDWVAAFLILVWYIRRYYALGDPGAYMAIPWDIRQVAGEAPPVKTRSRARLVRNTDADYVGIAKRGVVYIRPGTGAGR